VGVSSILVWLKWKKGETKKMAWTTPKTWADQELVTADLLNTHLRDNLNYLLHKIIGFSRYKPPSNYSTNNTSFVDVDAVNLKVSAELKGDRLLALVGPVVCSGNSGVAYAHLDLILNSTTRAGDTNNGLFRTFATNVGETAFLMGIWTDLLPGNKDVKLQFKASSGNAVQIHNLSHIHMILIEA
jgi:hypothetical protein